jgi:hypothetical protein
MALLLGVRAQAATSGLEVWGGLNMLRMSEVNDTLSSFNREYGTSLGPIRQDGTWGLGLRRWPSENVLLRLGYERLYAESKDRGVEFEIGAHAFTLGASGFLPSSGPVRCGVGLGLGPLLGSGHLVARGASLSTGGRGLTGHVTGEALAAIGRGWSLDGMVGYRFASIGKVKFGENTSDLSASYSGLFIRAGVARDYRAKN